MNIKNKKIYTWLIGLLGLTLFFAVPSVLAQVNTGIEFGTYTGLVNTDIRIIVAKIIRAALGLLGIIALCLIIYGGYEYMTAGGKEEQIEKAKDIIKNTVIGLVIILSSLAIAQFVISRLTTSIIGNYCAENPTDPSCRTSQYCIENPTDPSCLEYHCTGSGCNIFYATSTPHGQLLIKNPVVFVNFFRGSGFPTAVDYLTVSSTPSSPTPFQNIIVFKTSDPAQAPVAGYFEFLFNNTVVVFHPRGSCADAALGLGVGNNDCLEKNTNYTVRLKTSTDQNDINSLRDTTGRAIDCSTHVCQSNFTTGDKVDTVAPYIKMNKPTMNGLVERNYPTVIGSRYSDDVGVALIHYEQNFSQIDTLWYTINPDIIFTPGSALSLAGQADHGFVPSSRAGYALKLEWENLKGTAYDFAGHSTRSYVRIKNLPAFCWNGVVESQYKETQAGIAHVIPDCGLGSECGNCPGQTCTDNGDCAGTYCDQTSKICIARPKITDINPVSGAAGNYITLAGYSFGSPVGKVLFVTSTGSIEAEIVSCPLNSPSTLSWSNFYTVVKVPAGQLNSTSSIRLETSSYNNTTNSFQYDSTDDDWGWDGFYTYTTDKWPGLSCVKPNSGRPEDTNIQIAGTNLGSTRGYLKFGDLQTDSAGLTWNNILISGITVPNLPEQILSLRAVINGGETNSLPFTILKELSSTEPHIDSIDPVSGPAGSYVTIVGKNFGAEQGSVVLLKPGDNEHRYFNFNPPSCGGQGWGTNQILIAISKEIPLGNYKLHIETKPLEGAGFGISSNEVDFTVNNDVLGPSLCSVSPDNGPFGTLVTFKGERLFSSPHINGQTSSSIEYWHSVSSTGPWGLPKAWPGSSEITDLIPQAVTTGPARFRHGAASTGPVKVWVESLKAYSNALTFTVQDCKQELQKPGKTLAQVCGANKKCCGNGVCVFSSSLCPEEEVPKFSVYGWAFTTDIWGKADCMPGTPACPNAPPVPPHIPRVLQQCGTYCTNPDDGLVNFSEPCATTAECATKYNETGYVCNSVTPSPSPAAMWPKSADICVNAAVNVLFDSSITNDGADLTNINAQNIMVILPAGSNTSVAGTYSVSSQTDSINFAPNEEFATGTVYNVLVTTKAKSKFTDGSEANMLPKSNCPEYQGVKAAYCFSFTTKDTSEKCVLGSATIKPFVTVTSTLNKTLSNFYQVYPLAENNDCVVLNPSAYDWNWHPSDLSTPTPAASSIYASVSHNDADSDVRVDNIQSLTIKNLETTANAQIITATWNDDPFHAAFGNKIHGTAYLTLAQKKPEVIDFWPSCDGACRNGEIGFTFNIPVLKNSLWHQQIYYSNVTLESCPNTLCTGGTTTPIHIKDSSGAFISNTSSGSDTKFTIVTDSGFQLQPDTYYRVLIRNASSTEGAPLFVKNGPNKFFSSNVFYWIFHTKKGADSCAIASVNLTPQTGTATWVGQQVGFTSQAYGSPDQCAPQTGQKLNSNSYDWTWSSANSNIATVSALDRGAVLIGSKSIAGSYCGDNTVQSGQNEQCDGVVNCALDCRNNSGQAQGTVACAKTNDLNCCGNNSAEDNEQCDLGAQNGQAGSGCTNSCLLTTKHPISINHCLATITNTQAGGSTAAQKLSACTNIYGAVSVCGNSGALELGEQCDLGAQNGQAGSGCSNICLAKAYVSGSGSGQCGNKAVDFSNNEQCDGGQDCTSNCQFNVSSGDGRIDPFQYATAIGNGVTDQTTKKQVTTITAVTATDKTAVANFILQCGYKPINAACTCTAPNTCGISEDTCCYERPAVETILPNESSNICPNSLLSVQFDQIMDTASFVSSTQGFYNIILAKSYTGTEVVCPAGELQVSKEDINPVGIWQNIKYTVRNFFGLPVEALINCEGAVKYSLKSEIISGNKTKVSLLLDKPLEVSQSYKIIVKDNVKNSHGVSLHAVSSNDVKSFSTRSKMCKITDVDLIPGGWLFTTTQNDSSDDDVGVTTTYDKNDKDSDKIFKAEAYFTDPLVLNAEPMLLQPFSATYDWEYAWSVSPQSNTSIQISNVSQHLDYQKVSTISDAINSISHVGVALKVKVDTSAESEIGKTFSTTSTVQVFICDNPWPGRNFHELPDGSSLGLGYFDVFNADEQVFGTPPAPLLKGKAWTNFRLLYCRDYLQQGTSDDLPELKKPVALYHTVSGDPVLKEFFLTFTPPAQGSTVKVDNDSIGIRIYPNSNHSSLMAWYKSQPWIPIGVPTPAKVGNYEALQEGRTYYINGLNTSSTGSNNLIYSNVYVFSFSDNPTNETLNIVKQLLDNLELNANLVAENSDNIEPMYRDFRRLQDLQATAKLLAKYREVNGSYPQLNENPTLGTFLPSYTNSKWNSWQGVLGNLLGTAIPTDPLNGFYGCGSTTLTILDTTLQPPANVSLENFDSNTCWNAQDLKFVCPNNSHVYQYNFVDGTHIGIKADFELDSSNWIWDHPLQNTCSQSGNLCINNSECTTGETCDSNSIGFTLNNSCNNLIISSATKCGVCQPGEYVAEACTPVNDPATTINESLYSGKKLKICKNDCSGFEYDLNSNLQHWWKADNNTSDSVGTLNAISHGSVNYVNGYNSTGKAFNLNGSNAYVEIPNLPQLNNEFSLSLWVKQVITSSNGTIFSTGDNDNTKSRLWIYTNNTTNKVIWRGSNPDPGPGDEELGVNFLTDGSWQHLVFVKTADDCYFYVNNSKSGDSAKNLCSSWDISTINTTNTSLGTNTGKNIFFKGAIDDVRMYSKALTATEVNDLYNNKSLPQCVSQGFCGDGVKQGPETCDDGSNNGKDGYCNASCSNEIIVCGNNQTDSGKEICDSSTFNKKWCSGNNIIDCTNDSSLCSGNSGACVESGEKYAKKSTEQSCSWDCQSKEFCGDKIVQPQYEACETGESCQVGQCINSGSANNGNFCEKNEDCQVNIVCDNVLQTCSNDSTKSCTNATDCKILAQCTSYVPGKKYCQAPGEFTILAQSVGGKTVYVDATTSPKISENDPYFDSIGCNWAPNPSSAMPGVYCLPSAPIVLPPQSNSCGIDADKDGNYLDPGENCDNGPINGDIPPLGYNETKTYCDFGCDVATVSSGLYCGNSTIETPPESCDIGIDYKNILLTAATAGSNPTNFCENTSNKTFQYQFCANDCGSFLTCPSGYKQCADQNECPDIFCGNGVENKNAPFNEFCDASKDYNAGVTFATVIANPENFCVNNSDKTIAPQLKYESCSNSCSGFDSLSCGDGWTSCANATTNAICSMALCGNGVLDTTSPASEQCDPGISSNAFFCADKGSLNTSSIACSSQCKFPTCAPQTQMFCTDEKQCPIITINFAVLKKDGVYSDSQFFVYIIDDQNNQIANKEVTTETDSISFRGFKDNHFNIKIMAKMAGGGFAQGKIMYDVNKMTIVNSAGSPVNPVLYTTPDAWEKMITAEGSLIISATQPIKPQQSDLNTFEIDTNINAGIAIKQFNIAMPKTCDGWTSWLNTFTNQPSDFTANWGDCVSDNDAGYITYDLTVK